MLLRTAKVKTNQLETMFKWGWKDDKNGVQFRVSVKSTRAFCLRWRATQVVLDIFLDGRAGIKDAPRFTKFGAVWQKGLLGSLPRDWRIEIRMWNLKKEEEGSSAWSCSPSPRAWSNHRNEICRDKSLLKCANSEWKPFQNTEKQRKRIAFSYAHVCLLSSAVIHTGNREVLTLSPL